MIDIKKEEELIRVSLEWRGNVDKTIKEVLVCGYLRQISTTESNNIMVSKQIIFRTIAHQDDVSTIWGIDRQDLLAALVKERFQWSNILGTQLIKTYDSGKVAENGYYYRNMYFEQTAPNDIQNRLKSNRLDKLGRDYYG